MTVVTCNPHSLPLDGGVATFGLESISSFNTMRKHYYSSVFCKWGFVRLFWS